jgi:hypothetical protein
MRLDLGQVTRWTVISDDRGNNLQSTCARSAACIFQVSGGEDDPFGESRLLETLVSDRDSFHDGQLPPSARCR